MKSTSVRRKRTDRSAAALLWHRTLVALVLLASAAEAGEVKGISCERAGRFYL